MDSESLMLLGAVVLIVLGVVMWWRRRAGDAKNNSPGAIKAAPRDKRRGPRRINNSRREGFRMGKDDNERRSDKDRRHRKPGWDNDSGDR